MTSSPLPDEDRLAFINDEYEDVEDELQTIPADANEADVIEQHQELPDDEDGSALGTHS